MIPSAHPIAGLQPLEAEDAGIFFGRDGPTVVGLDLLRGLREAAPPRLLVILGASGAGKSSFLRAGLLPRLARESQHFLPLPVIRPERAVLTGESRGSIASSGESAEGGRARPHARRHPQGHRVRRSERRVPPGGPRQGEHGCPHRRRHEGRASPRRWSLPSIRPKSCSMRKEPRKPAPFSTFCASSPPRMHPR